MNFGLAISDELILAKRPPKNLVDVGRPYAFLVEPEHQANGCVEDVAVLFLTNRECPYRCLMCDLWKNTTDQTVPIGAIPDQIDFALRQLPKVRHIKLYNSGNFFDPAAIPPNDYPAIANRIRDFTTVIVENHPQMCGTRVLDFVNELQAVGSTAVLEVAMGLETIHPRVLPLLNKRLTTDAFRRACDYLHSLGVMTRAFVLLRPPTLTEEEGLEWASRSAEFAFDCGVSTVTVIPTRSGNGIMEQMQADGLFEQPSLASLEAVSEVGLALGRGRFFVDLWDAQRFATEATDACDRIERLHQMNLGQCILPPINGGPAVSFCDAPVSEADQ
jgi:radical SAM enzyme (TIGR01210 family)